MKAIVWTGYGSADVLQLKEIEKPTPKDNEVLIKIVATTVTSGDCEQRGLRLPIWQRLAIQAYVGIRKPTRITILGMELAGEIKAVGKDVKRFKQGDSVFATTGFVGMGTYAEYICLPEEPEGGVIETKPANITYEEAAPIPVGGLEALSFLRQGNIQSGQKVLINGAGGTIGTYAVQLSKYFGAEVTAVDSIDKLDIIQSIGADYIIDYTKENVSDNKETYDFILDVAGKISFSSIVKLLKPKGRYLIANPSLSQMIHGRWISMTNNRNVMFGVTYPKIEDLVFLKELITTQKIRTIIDRLYSLEQISEAHRYVESGNKAGHVVIRINPHKEI